MWDELPALAAQAPHVWSAAVYDITCTHTPTSIASRQHAVHLGEAAVCITEQQGCALLWQGMGKQKAGSVINIVGQLFVALPFAVILAFVLRFGVEGLLTGKCSRSLSKIDGHLADVHHCSHQVPVSSCRRLAVTGHADDSPLLLAQSCTKC